jgi:hypothetical protein
MPHKYYTSNQVIIPKPIHINKPTPVINLKLQTLGQVTNKLYKQSVKAADFDQLFVKAASIV